jgi:hypothetical protein
MSQQQNMLERKYIEPTNPDEAHIASPFFYLWKKDGSDQPVQDYCKANMLMQHDHYPVPLIPPTIACIQNASIFTKFDVCQGYNNIRIKKADRHKAAFKTEFVLRPSRGGSQVQGSFIRSTQ